MFKIIIAPDVKNDEDDYDDDEDLDGYDDDPLALSSRILFNLYLEENNKAPVELTQFRVSDFDMLPSSQGVKYELLAPTQSLKVSEYEEIGEINEIIISRMSDKN